MPPRSANDFGALRHVHEEIVVVRSHLPGAANASRARPWGKSAATAGSPTRHAHIVRERAPTLRHDHHLERARGLDDLLTRVPTRLVAALHTGRTHRLHATQVRQRVVERGSDRLDRSFRAVENRPGREDPRPNDLARLRRLGGAEDHLGPVRRVVHRRHPEREVRENPVGARRDLARPGTDVRMRVHEPRHDELSSVDTPRFSRNGN